MERLTSKRTREEVDWVSEIGYKHIWERIIWERLNEIENILGDDYDLDRLKELAQADREGKCVVLPCRVGDKVYCIQSYFNDAKMRSEKKVKCRVVDFMQSLPNLFECEGMIYKFSDIGKTVFLTSEEAESALKAKDGELV